MASGIQSATGFESSWQSEDLDPCLAHVHAVRSVRMVELANVSSGVRILTGPWDSELALLVAEVCTAKSEVAHHRRSHWEDHAASLGLGSRAQGPGHFREGCMICRGSYGT